MSKLLHKLGFFLCLFFTTACSSSVTPPNKKAKVLCTTQFIANTVEKLAGDIVDIEVLIQGELDPHSYQLVKGDAEKFTESQIVFANGLNLEHGHSLKQAIDNHKHAVKLGDYIYYNEPESILLKDNELDPHIWMDISIWLKTIDPIVDGLVKEFPSNQDLFVKNAETLKKNWKDLDQNLQMILQKIPSEKRYLVTSHDAFNYFSRKYLATDIEVKNKTWTDRFKAPEGLSPDGQIGPYDIKKILDHLKKYNISVVFPESNVSLDSLKKIRSVAAAQGMKIIFAKEPLFGDSMCGDEFSVSSYEEMMKHNVQVIASYLEEM